MKHNANKLRLTDRNTFKDEIKQYDNIITHRQSKYNSLAEMKRQIYLEISSYSDEELDFLRSYIKSKETRADKVLSGFFARMGSHSNCFVQCYLGCSNCGYCKRNLFNGFLVCYGALYQRWHLSLEFLLNGSRID